MANVSLAMEGKTMGIDANGNYKSQNFDEGLLRKRSQFMWPGPLRRIRFQFTGPSVQAILDRIPTARVVEKKME